jgi:small conductance mechanosensitive channel
MWEQFFYGPMNLRAALEALVPTLVVAWLLARGARSLAAAGLRALVQDSLAESSPLVRGPLRLIEAVTFLLAAAILLFPAFQVAGLRPRAGLRLRTLETFTFGAGLRIVAIVLLGYALVRTIALLVKRFEHEMTQGTGLDALERAKRARTLGSVVSKVTNILVIGIAVLMVLRELDMDIAPVLTGAGIVGLAVGFGAQTLVRDVISGFFMILENQVRVGDVAAINGVGGAVEEINLRTVVLRDEEGTVHVFPNGGITTLANRSKDFSYYVIVMNVSYYDDTGRVEALLRTIGADLQADPKFGPSILAPIEILGVDGFSDWAVQLKLRIKTVPLKQWEVGRELRKRIAGAFTQHGFHIPFPVPATAIPTTDRQ